jgi:hypothetical protein
MKILEGEGVEKIRLGEAPFSIAKSREVVFCGAQQAQI